MSKKLIFFAFVGLAIVTASLSSCKKPLSFSAGNLEFSRDTVVFDTIFTTVGSTTKRFKIYNRASKTLKIDQIVLEGGANSPFRMNVDGTPGTHISDIELEGGDSLFVFVEVTLDPNNGTTPLVIEDNIHFTTNGTQQSVNLMAWGQDAYFHYSDFSLPNGTGLDINSGTWPNDKPHVILNYAFVDSAQSLTIPAGTKIHLHKNAILYVYKGSLNIEGSYGNEVTFEGDRLESYYDDVSGQYFGIFFFEARTSSINYAKIKNGIAGIQMFGADVGNSNYTLELTNTTIENCGSYGMAVYNGAKVKAENCIFGRNVGNQVRIGLADFNFNHCHFTGYNGDNSGGNAVAILNYFINGNDVVDGSINEGTITNSVIYGFGDYELGIDTIPGFSNNLNFQYNLIKSDIELTGPEFSNNFWNLDPEFKDEVEGNFLYWSISPLIDAGSSTFPNTLTNSFGVDLRNLSRPIGNAPDIGAYELY